MVMYTKYLLGKVMYTKCKSNPKKIYFPHNNNNNNKKNNTKTQKQINKQINTQTNLQFVRSKNKPRSEQR